MEMKFLVGFGFTTTTKLILIITKYHCMLLLAAALHSLITDMAWKFKLTFQAISVIGCAVQQLAIACNES